MSSHQYKVSIVRDLLTELLISKGFKRVRSNWRRETEQTYQLANIQRSTYGPYFFLNFAIFFKAIEPDVVPHRAFGHLRFRAGDRDLALRTEYPSETFKGDVAHILDEDKDFTSEQRREFINGPMWQIAAKMLDKYSDLKVACEHAHLPRLERITPMPDRRLLEFCGVEIEPIPDY